MNEEDAMWGVILIIGHYYVFVFIDFKNYFA